LPTPKHLEIIPLGGLGEFGMNCTVYRHGSDCLVVDAGMMFPGAEHLGVDVVVPSFTFLDDCGTLHGVILTHGHEDHVGALPYLLARHDMPVHASAHTRELVRARLGEHEGLAAARLRPLPPAGEAVQLGPYSVECLAAAHSIPQSKMLVLSTPVGTVVHTADFKLDPRPPDGEVTDLSRLAELGREGVLVLLSDSTNADRPGFTEGERVAARAIEAQVASSPRRVLVTTFASNVQRLQQISRIAERHGRRLALVGRSVQTQAEVAERLGLIRFPPGRRVTAEQAMELPPDEVLIVATGSQGEPMSALARIAVAKHRTIGLAAGDRVIHSARIIPGNQKSIGSMINHLLQRGADVITGDDATVHVSGHPSQDELTMLLQIVRPRWLVPIHGEYRQLHAHAGLAVEAGLPPGAILLAASGDRIVVNDAEIAVADRVPVGRTFIDAGLDEVDLDILRDRRRIAGDGIVVPVIAVDRESGSLNGDPEIVTRGFVADTDGLLEGASRIVAETLADASPEERTDEAMLKARIQAGLRRYLRRRTQRRPLIIPVIVEL
jgi:ribonuclease J